MGVWQRTLLEGAGIARDTESLVFWLQTRHWHGDLRLLPGRPDFTGCSQLSDTSTEQRRWLSTQKGFAGVTEVVVRGNVVVEQGAATAADPVPTLAGQAVTYCEWHRRLDFQPRGAGRDIGSMHFSPDFETVEEIGVEAEYHETWRRLPRSGGASAAWRHAGKISQDPSSLLLMAGDYFFHLRDRPFTLTKGSSDADLSTMYGRSGDLALLDMELSFGEWNSADGRGMILHSTLPWRERKAVALSAAWQPIDSSA